MIALTGCTGKLGGAVLEAIIEYNIVPADEIVICTTGNPQGGRWDDLKKKGVIVRQSNFEDPTSMVTAFSGCDKLFLVSSPTKALDYNAAVGSGREKHHIAAIKAAQAAGISHIYYTSLAFRSDPKAVDSDSKAVSSAPEAGVMLAHNRTEAFLAGMRNMKFTSIREGLYGESWPLYFGHFDVKDKSRKVVVVGGDGAINWTAIADLGLASALVVADPSERYVGQTFYLSGPKTATLKEIAGMVSQIRGTEVSLKVVSRDEYIRYYAEEKGMDKGFLEWWAGTYDALKERQCEIEDKTLISLLHAKGRTPKLFEDTVKEMLG